MVYFITYDLNNPGQNYDDVINAIKEAWRLGVPIGNRRTW